MRDDHATGFHRGVKRIRYIVIGQPMKAVAPHTFSIETMWQGERVIHKRMGAVEGRIETRHLQGVGKRRHGLLDTCQIVRLMQRCQRRKLCQVGDHILVRTTGAVWSIPPCTTRWPTATMSPKSACASHQASTAAKALPNSPGSASDKTEREPSTPVIVTSPWRRAAIEGAGIAPLWRVAGEGKQAEFQAR
jgi:hypothetical protein